MTLHSSDSNLIEAEVGNWEAYIMAIDFLLTGSV